MTIKKTRRWSSDEIKYLRDNYRSMGAKHCATVLGRGLSGIESAAWHYGVQNPIWWTKAEVRILREHYVTGGPAAVMALLPARSSKAIRAKAKKLRVRREVYNTPAKPRAVTLLLVRHVADEMGCTASDVLGRSRDRKFVVARYRVAKMLRERGYSFMAIGAQLGRDHSSIILGIRRHA